jgi:hypothetical protein
MGSLLRECLIECPWKVQSISVWLEVSRHLPTKIFVPKLNNRSTWNQWHNHGMMAHLPQPILYQYPPDLLCLTFNPLSKNITWLSMMTKIHHNHDFRCPSPINIIDHHIVNCMASTFRFVSVTMSLRLQGLFWLLLTQLSLLLHWQWIHCTWMHLST